MPPEHDEVLAWIEKAEHDRRTAAAALDQDPPITDTAAFHCQQAAEKYLKAFLVSRGNLPPRTHDLRLLAVECAKHDSRFARLVDRVAPLTAYAVRFRYPGVAEPSLASVQAAQETVRIVRDVVRAALGIHDEENHED